MNIFVGGSLRSVPVYDRLCPRFVKRLGELIVEHGHTLLTGCRGSLDKAIAKSAHNSLHAKGMNSRLQLVSYRLKNDEPAHRFGRIQVSKRTDWELTHPDLNPPEQIAEADVTIFVAGSEGTFIAANWARIADKPILGVAQFGGAGAQIYTKERDRFGKRYSHFVTKENFDMLNQDTEDVGQLAEDVISLCEQVMTPNTVFTIMSFREDFRDVYTSYQELCKGLGFEAIRVDQCDFVERIIPRILDGIRRAAFVIADVSEPSPNVHFEIGYAKGLGRPVILTAREGTSLPFDIVDIPVVFWKCQEDLKEKLREVIAATRTNCRIG